MKKLFGGINLTWTKLIILAILSGIYTAVVSMVPGLLYTSFHTIAVTFEVWIFFGIFIIMNSKSNKDSALKCFVFFLISQPLVYLIQDVITGSNLFRTYYFNWFIWTILCIPMGYIGYYMKKDKWWGYIILLPMILMDAEMYSAYLSDFMFSYPKYILITIFCAATLIIYPLYIFNNKKIKTVGVTISTLLIIVFTIYNIVNPPIYKTQIMASNEEHQLDDTYKAYLTDSKYGDIEIIYDSNLEEYMLEASFKKEGKTNLIIESPNKEKQEFTIDIKRDTYDINKK